MMNLIQTLEFIAECVGLVACVLFAGIFIASLKYNHMFKKKYGPQKTEVKCPLSEKRLSDFELMYGHCVHCKSKLSCQKEIKKDHATEKA